MTASTLADISVVICAYTMDRWAELRAAVESLRRQSAPPREIVVVVDHNPALLDHARAELPGVTTVANAGPRGLSGARNSGVATSRGALVAFMDEDARAAPDWLARLAAGYADPCALGVGGAILPLWSDGRPGWFPDEFAWVVGCTYRGMPTTSAPVRNLIGCNMSFRREVFEHAGGFRSGIGRIGARPVGCEETELCIRARQRWPRGVLLYEPRAQVFHHVPASRARWRYFRSRCYGEGLSKALVARIVGAGDGLESERAYALRTLPQGIARGLADAAQRGDPAGRARAGAIAAGLSVTAAGYLAGSIALWRAARAGEAHNTFAI